MRDSTRRFWSIDTVVRGQLAEAVLSMADELTLNEICRLLELEPNAICGFVRDVREQAVARSGSVAGSVRGPAALSRAEPAAIDCASEPSIASSVPDM